MFILILFMVNVIIMEETDAVPLYYLYYLKLSQMSSRQKIKKNCDNNQFIIIFIVIIYRYKNIKKALMFSSCSCKQLSNIL